MKKMLYKFAQLGYRLIPLRADRKKKIVAIITQKRKMTKKQLIHKIQKYQVISFDIFDTLITRTLYQPDDLFQIIGEIENIPDFLNMRKQAEIEANRKWNHDCNLDEIYEELNHLYHLDSKKLKELEISLELEFCIPRKDMLDVFYKIKKNHKIILVSDMYLNREIIEKMLAKCGYSGYDKLYLSNELNKRKDNKTIWDDVLQENKNIVHIGDNLLSDYEYPKEFHIDTIKIESGISILQKSKANIFLKDCNSSGSNSIFLGLIINKILCNSPFSDGNIVTLEQFGYTLIAPFMFEFMKFIDEQEGPLLFLAREGYQLQKLYVKYCDIFKKKQKQNFYFLSSRKASTIYETKEDIEKSCSQVFNGSIANFLEQIFDIKVENNMLIELPKDKDTVIPIVLSYAEDIIAQSLENKKNYISYMKKMIPNYQKVDLTLVDLGYSGTIQYNLSRILNQHIKGCYLTNSDSVKRFFSDSILEFCFDIHEDPLYQKIYHYSLILEFFLSAPFGQLLKFAEQEGEIIPIYNQEKMDSIKEHTLDTIFNGVISYMEDIHHICEVFHIDIDKRLIAQIYIGFIETSSISYEVKDQFRFQDAYCGTKEYNVFKKISRY